jgi:hypothetical protein
MARLMSVSLTEQQVRDRSKPLTRRDGWGFLQAGDRLVLFGLPLAASGARGGRERACRRGSGISCGRAGIRVAFGELSLQGKCR